MHSAGICHRDLKLENIMVEMPENHEGKKEIVCKLTDFGFACEINPSS